MKRIAIEGKDLDRARLGIDQPVFPDASTGIERPFGEQIAAAVGRAHNLDHEVGGTFDSAQFHPCITIWKHHKNIWLNRVPSLE